MNGRKLHMSESPCRRPGVQCTAQRIECIIQRRASRGGRQLPHGGIGEPSCGDFELEQP
jgi:hypothetical protein